ncbi:hypothetical protein [Pseudomonas fluorescens]|uniref:hypothetical protein n=1 Tax=Pseudomonas fluorescens TaxID=294 RepID=UPI00036A7031|nr:hypothetical protein [Pseudomonas fluorescens]
MIDREKEYEFIFHGTLYNVRDKLTSENYRYEFGDRVEKYVNIDNFMEGPDLQKMKNEDPEMHKLIYYALFEWGDILFNSSISVEEAYSAVSVADYARKASQTSNINKYTAQY